MGSPLSVLLIEDDEVDQEVVIRCLKPHTRHFTLTITPDARQALALLHNASNSFAIIVLNLALPRMDGFEFLYILRQHLTLKETLVIVLTGSTSAQDRMRANHYDVAGYLVKDELDGRGTQLIDLLEKARRDRYRRSRHKGSIQA